MQNKVKYKSWFMKAGVTVVVLATVIFAGAANEVNDVNSVKATANKKSDLDIVKEKLADKTKPMTWVFTGDSIVMSCKFLDGMRGYPELFAERVRYELYRKSDMVINSGISGLKAKDGLADFEWRVSRFKPDVVSIMYGMNDARSGETYREPFKKCLTELVQKVRATGAIPILNTYNTRVEAYKDTRPDLEAYNDIIRAVAKENNVILMDHWEYWKKMQADEGMRLAWMGHSVHPNGYGHRVFARLIFETLGIYDAKSPTCKLFIPQIQ